MIVPESALDKLAPLISRLSTKTHWVKKSDGPRHRKTPLTKTAVMAHLAGTGEPVGCAAIPPGKTTTMVGLLDFDSHKGEVPWDFMCNVAAGVGCWLMEQGNPPSVFRSSGGQGIHLYVLWEAPQDAAAVRQLLAAALDSVGLENGTGGVLAGEAEIFPKQAGVALDAYGSMFILPLAGGSKSTVLGFPLMEDLGADVNALEWIFGVAPPPAVVHVERVQNAAPSEIKDNDLKQLVAALEAIPNSGDKELDYDTWRNVVFGIHYATDGSDTGLWLADEFSAKSSKHNSAFLENRVWPYVRTSLLGAPAVTDRTLYALARAEGWNDSSPDDYEDLVALAAAQDAAGGAGGAGSGSGGVPGLGGAGATPALNIPRAQHLCTDQANAGRIARHFGRQLMVSAGRWHAWTGTHWANDEGEVYRCACKLSKLIKGEAQAWVDKAWVDQAERDKNLAIADALTKWSMRSEMRSSIEAAVALARKMLVVDAAQLDRDPWALNCLNGTVDLRTAELRQHEPLDYITKCTWQTYDPAAVAPLFHAVLPRITLEEDRETKPVALFLQRWFGYCATGSTREQKFVVHWGTGSNGKSTLLDLVADVLGDYAGNAAPGLLVASGNDRHPTEIADLFGLRMVTAHETSDSGMLREDFVKQATGSDKIKARFMRADFFQFEPTHKLQLITNHKPMIRGQDHGMWRRVLLMPYLAKFGSPDDVVLGIAQFVRDTTIVDQLRGEMAGVLAWVVAGAVTWYRDGLAPPSCVVAASIDYKHEQDRAQQFVDECCELDVLAETPLAEGFDGIYPAYVSWAKEGGLQPLSKRKLVNELERVVPGFQKSQKITGRGEGGKRRDVTVIKGLKLLL